MKSLRASVALLVTTFVAAFLAQPVQATPTIDQQSTGTPNATISSTLGNQVGQSFTAGQSGSLTRIDVGSVIRNVAIGSLTVQVFDAAGGFPTGAAIASTSIAEVDVPSGSVGSITAEFTSPATVISGRQYVFTLVPQTGSLQIVVVDPGSYLAGTTIDNGPSSWALVGGANPDMVFTTYVDGAPTGPAPTFQIALNPTDGTTCSTSSESGTSGTWLTLPGATDCSPPATKPNAKLLGWSTTPNFPVAIAQRQIANGWGAYETFNAEGRIASVFIPAGGATVFSGSNSLHAIWSE